MPVVLDNITTARNYSASSLSLSHSFGASANIALVKIHTISTGSPTLTAVTIGGNAATLVGSKIQANAGIYYSVFTYKYSILGGGTKTIAVSLNTATLVTTLACLSFNGAGNVTGYNSAQATSTSSSLTVASASTSLVVYGLSWDYLSGDSAQSDASMNQTQSYKVEPGICSVVAGTTSKTCTATLTQWGNEDDGPYDPLWVADICSVDAGAGGNSYTLTAGQGSFTESGVSAGLKAARRVAATQASFVETGIAVNFKRGLKFSAGVGSYSVSGIASGLKFGRLISATPAGYVLSSKAANVLYGRRMSVSVASYLLVGKDIVFRRSKGTLTAACGSFVLARIDARLIKRSILRAGYGAILLHGNDVNLTSGLIASLEQSRYAKESWESLEFVWKTGVPIIPFDSHR